MVGRVLVLAVVVLTSADARADSAKLGQAKAAIEAVHFEDAQRLLVEALAEGGNGETAVRQIYELSANVAAVLGQRDVAEQFYRRWLALDPQAKLGNDVPPKLADAFVAAQAYMAAHGRLVASARRTATGVEVTIEADPLAMAASANGTPFGGDRRALVNGERVAILDEHRNELLVLQVAPQSVATEAPGMLPAARRPLLKRWQTWAVASSTVLLAGAIWGTVALSENQALASDHDKSGTLFFTQYEQRVHTMQRNAVISLSLLGAGTLIAIPAAVLYVKSRRPSDLSRLAIVPAPALGGAVVIGRF
jgi:hypothetical protein